MPSSQSPLRRGKYRPIADFLAIQDADTVRLTFVAIEELISSSLPVSAYTSASHWRTKSAPAAHIWMAIGWEVTQIDRREQAIVFQRLRQE